MSQHINTMHHNIMSNATCGGSGTLALGAPPSITWSSSPTLTSGPGVMGAVYTTNTTGGYTFAADPNLKGHTLSVKGNAEFDGEVTIKGKNLTEMIEKIESRLAILHPNEKLEEKWENLRGLREAYVALEKEIIEKEAMWAILKR